jgi:transposase-like protein
VRVNSKNLIDDGQCERTIRELRWPNGIECPSCQCKHVIKRGFDDTESARQRYERTADCGCWPRARPARHGQRFGLSS